MNDELNILSQYQKKLAEITDKFENASLIFRGQCNAGWGLNSSADRRIKNSGLDHTTLPMSAYLNEYLLDPVRSENYNEADRELKNLELLAKLQHHGAATCLIDFTANFYIALWFACQDDKQDGEVFIINHTNINTFKAITPETMKDDIDKLLNPPQPEETKEYKAPPIYYWKAPANQNRTIAQQSYFIFSGQEIGESIYDTIIIEKSNKKAILDLLDKYHGLNLQTIFRDFTGFADSQSQSKKISVPSAFELLNQGNTYYQQTEYKKAISYYDKAIEFKPDDAEAYNNRGLAKIKLKHYQQAIADYDQAIAKKSNHAEAYYNRGNAKLALEQYPEAIENFDKSIAKKPNNAMAYSSRGLAKTLLNTKAKLKKYQEALEDYNQAIKLNPDNADTYINRGNAKVMLGHPQQAIADFNAAIELKPFHATCYNRGYIKEQLGAMAKDPAEKRTYYKQALEDATQAKALAQDNQELAKVQNNHVLATAQALIDKIKSKL